MVNDCHDKAFFRKLARELRKSHLNDAPAPFKDFTDLIISSTQFQASKTIAVYVKLPGEPDISDVIDYCFATSKRVVVPAWDADSGTYRFALMQPNVPLQKGNRDILEPTEKHWVRTDEIDFFLIPGLMFDKCGTRLGHGAGYYDKLLSNRSPNSHLVGVAFSWQISDVLLPSEPHDVAMNAVITA